MHDEKDGKVTVTTKKSLLSREQMPNIGQKESDYAGEVIKALREWPSPKRKKE